MKVVLLTPIRRQTEVCRTLLKLLLFPAIWISFCPSPVRTQSTQNRAEDAMITLMMGKNSEVMTKTTADNDTKPPASFYEILGKSLKKRKIRIENLCPTSDSVARRILEDYGAVFIASKKVMPPPVCIFSSEQEVTQFQERAGYTTERIGFDDIELQPEAMKALMKAREEAQKEGLDITPRVGGVAGHRTYADSLELWDTRFLPALDYWLAQGRLTEAEVARLKGLPLHDQIAEVLELEKSGVYFSKDLSKSIL